MADSFKNNALRMALIGKTGVGKSALGNTLLGRRVFNSSPGSTSETVKCNMEFAILPSGEMIQVVDTPGIMDTADRDMVPEVSKSIAYLSPGPHAFLLVLQPNRATTEEMNALKELQNLFGDDSYLNNTIIIMVRRNEIENEDGSLMSIHQFILTRSCEAVQDLYRKCGKRIIAVDNKEKDQDIQEKFRKEIVDMVKNFNGYYSHIYFQMVVKNKELQNALEEERENQTRQLAQLTMTCNEGQVKIDEQNKVLQQEIEKHERERKDLTEKLDKALQLFEKQLKESNKKGCVMS